MALSAAALFTGSAGSIPSAYSAVNRGTETDAPDTFAYGPDPAQQLDAYTDPVKANAPWVMVVHGGSWMGGDKADYTAKSIAAFRGAGFQAFSTNYRLSPVAPWPAQRDDVSAAVAYVRDHAAQFGIDADRGALYGVSAGGNVATGFGVKGGGSQIRAVVGVSSVLQPLRVWQYAHGEYTADGLPRLGAAPLAGWAAVLFRCPPVSSFTSCYGRWRDGTPQNYVSSDDPDTLLVHSQDDVASPIEGDVSFMNALNAAGGSAQMITAAGDVHDDNVIVWDSPTRAKWVLDWVKWKTE